MRHSELASRLRLLTGLAIALACLLLWLGGAVFGYAQAGGGGTARPLTTPPSSYEDSLVSRPDPVDSSGNLAITGNVTGGKHFRGEVPYRSTTSIDAPLGSTELDSFLRITEPIDLAETSRMYQPYHSPTGTAATLQPGSDGQSVPVAGSSAGTSASTLPPSAAVADTDRYGQQLLELQQRLDGLRAGVNALDQSEAEPDSEYGDPSPLDGTVPSRRDSLLQETARLLSTTLEPFDSGAPLAAWQTDVPAYRGPGIRLYDPQRDANITLEAVLAAADGRTDAPPLRQPVERIPQTAPTAQTSDRLALPATEVPLPLPVLPEARVDSAAPAHEPVAPTPTRTPTMSRGDYEVCLRAGQAYLTQGQYRRAADAFTSALAYDPKDAQANLGRCQALLGAGEFAASAMSLADAFDSDPAAALEKIDLVAVTGGPDAFLILYNDLAQQASGGTAPHLQLLLAYIYYQMDQRDLARMALQMAQEGLPDLPAVAYLRAALSQQ